MAALVPLTGLAAPATVVGIEEIFPFSPKFTHDHAQIVGEGTSAKAAGSDLGTSAFYLASLDRMAVFNPSQAARRPTRCATLLVHGDKDDTAPIATGEPVFAALPGTKEWQVIPGADHNTLDTKPGLTTAVEIVSHWFDRYLAPRPSA